MFTERHVVDRLPAYWLYNRAILGNFSLTTPKERFIINEFAIDYNGEIDTPGHHFNSILKQHILTKKNNLGSDLSYPYKSIPCSIPYGIYVDISHAYAQIAETYGLSCQFKEGRFFAYGEEPLERIFHEHKIMRALLVSGTGKQSSFTEWKNETLTTRKFYNRNYAPYLRYAITSTLHAIQHLLARYTIYAHTDGCITPIWYFKKVCKLLDERGVDYSIKAQGITQIYGMGSYRIGDISTRKHHHQSKTRSNIRGDFSEWWLDCFSRGKEYRSTRSE